MTDFERIKMYYGKGWATKAQVGKHVYFGKITPEEYTLITRDPYVA